MNGGEEGSLFRVQDRGAGKIAAAGAERKVCASASRLTFRRHDPPEP